MTRPAYVCLHVVACQACWCFLLSSSEYSCFLSNWCEQNREAWRPNTPRKVGLCYRSHAKQLQSAAKRLGVCLYIFGFRVLWSLHFIKRPTLLPDFIVCTVRWARHLRKFRLYVDMRCGSFRSLLYLQLKGAEADLSAATYQIHDESHTIGNALRWMIMKKCDFIQKLVHVLTNAMYSAVPRCPSVDTGTVYSAAFKILTSPWSWGDDATSMNTISFADIYLQCASSLGKPHSSPDSDVWWADSPYKYCNQWSLCRTYDCHRQSFFTRSSTWSPEQPGQPVRYSGGVIQCKSNQRLFRTLGREKLRCHTSNGSYLSRVFLHNYPTCYPFQHCTCGLRMVVHAHTNRLEFKY